MRHLIICGLAFFSLISWEGRAQHPDFQCLDPGLPEGMEITRVRNFEGSGLYGFMNGGSELFLEYGFTHLVEQSLTYQGLNFVVEYYLMEKPEQAYGIYSVHTFKCRRTDEVFPSECLIPGLLQLHHHRLYLVIKCMQRNAESQPMLDALAQAITQANPLPEGTPVPDLSAWPLPHSGNLYYIQGDLGLSAAHISWAEAFLPFSGYEMWLRIDPETGTPRAWVKFASEADAILFKENNPELAAAISLL